MKNRSNGAVASSILKLSRALHRAHDGKSGGAVASIDDGLFEAGSGNWPVGRATAAGSAPSRCKEFGSKRNCQLMFESMVPAIFRARHRWGFWSQQALSMIPPVSVVARSKQIYPPLAVDFALLPELLVRSVSAQCEASRPKLKQQAQASF